MPAIAERNLRSVDLNLLVLFDALMAERNVTRAAARNGLSQPAVSKALNRLRYLFDDPLFVLHDRAMEPTARARQLAGPIRGALADISRTLTLPEEFDPATIQATVKIATNDLYHSSLLPSLIRHLRRHAPGVDLQVRAIDRSRLQEQLAAGEIDVAFAPLGTKGSEISAEPLWNDRLVTLVGENNPLREAMTIEAFAAAGHLVDAGHVQASPDGSRPSPAGRSDRTSCTWSRARAVDLSPARASGWLEAATGMSVTPPISIRRRPVLSICMSPPMPIPASPLRMSRSTPPSACTRSRSGTVGNFM
jgi:DNA-binding transcriptional LysR family regulator